jgi:hypothetical protein
MISFKAIAPKHKIFLLTLSLFVTVLFLQAQTDCIEYLQQLLISGKVFSLSTSMESPCGEVISSFQVVTEALLVSKNIFTNSSYFIHLTLIKVI